MTHELLYRNIDTALFLRDPLSCPLEKDTDNLLYLDWVSIPKIQFNPVELLCVKGLLPFRSDLLKIGDGMTFELYWAECGDLAMAHKNGILLHRFTNCRVVERVVKNAITFNELEILGVDLVLSCDIETPKWQVSP